MEKSCLQEATHARFSKINLNWKLIGQLVSNCKFILQIAPRAMPFTPVALNQWLCCYGGLQRVANSAQKMQGICVPEIPSQRKSTRHGTRANVKAHSGAGRPTLGYPVHCKCGSGASLSLSLSGRRAPSAAASPGCMLRNAQWLVGILLLLLLFCEIEMHMSACLCACMCVASWLSGF